MARLTVVIPALRPHSALLRRSVMSVEDSSAAEVEIVVVQDTDPMPDARSVTTYAPTARVFAQEDLTTSEAINLGVAEALGEFVGVLLPGCIYMPGALNTVVGRLAEDPRIDVLHGASRHLTADWSRRWEAGAIAWDADAALASVASPFAPSAAFFRRADFLEAGGCRFDHAWDLDLWLRLSRNGARFEAEASSLAEQYERIAGHAAPAKFIEELLAIVDEATAGAGQIALRRRATASAHARALSFGEDLPLAATARHLAGAIVADPARAVTYLRAAAGACLKRRRRAADWEPRAASTVTSVLALALWAGIAISAVKTSRAPSGAETGKEP